MDAQKKMTKMDIHGFRQKRISLERASQEKQNVVAKAIVLQNLTSPPSVAPSSERATSVLKGRNKI